MPGTAGSLKATVEVVKRLFLGTGSTVIFWHAFCLPTVWALEGSLLLPLVLMALYGRAPPTAVFIASFGPGTGVYAVKQQLAGLCSQACKIALSVNHATSAVCEFETSTAGNGLQVEAHLIATLVIFVQYLLPLYFRWGAGLL